MENISVVDISILISLAGLIFVVLNFNKNSKKDNKAEIEEAKEYKMKVEKALLNTDENRTDIANIRELVTAVQELTQKMGLVLEDMATSRARMIELELLKADGVELLLNHHRGESVELENFASKFAEVKQESLRAQFR